MENSNTKNLTLKKVIDNICGFMDTPYFSMALVAIQLTFYFLGLDIFNIVLISLIISFSFIFKKNLNILLTIFLFMATMISVKNSPGFGGHGVDNEIKSYFFKPEIYITAIIFAAIPVSIAIIKAILNFVNKKIEINISFVVTILAGIGFLTNGLFIKPYNPLNLMYGLFMFFFIVILYFAIIPYIEINKENIRNISTQIAIFLLIPLIEVTFSYIRYAMGGNNPFTRDNFVFVGWGNRNTVGMILLVSLPFLFYLLKFEKNKKLKVIFWIENVLVIAAVLLTFSRQTYVFLFFLVTLYFLIILLRSPKERRLKASIHLISWLVGSITYLSIFHFGGIFESIGLKMNLSNRLPLWEKGLNAFRNNPIFGEGFFFIGGDQFVRIESLIPYFVHNTVIEVFGAMGLFGGITYLAYRFVTTYKIFFNMSKEKIYPVMSCSIFVLMSLVDIHIFDLLGTAIYVSLFAMSMSKAKKE